MWVGPPKLRGSATIRTIKRLAVGMVLADKRASYPPYRIPTRMPYGLYLYQTLGLYGAVSTTELGRSTHTLPHPTNRH
jgi:hypothetical protein